MAIIGKHRNQLEKEKPIKIKRGTKVRYYGSNKNMTEDKKYIVFGHFCYLRKHSDSKGDIWWEWHQFITLKNNNGYTVKMNLLHFKLVPEDELPYPIINEHIIARDGSEGNGYHGRCKYCGLALTTDLGYNSWSGTKCIDREDKVYGGLSAAEHDYWYRHRGFRYNPDDRLWNKPYENETFTSNQLRQKFQDFFPEFKLPIEDENKG